MTSSEIVETIKATWPAIAIAAGVITTAFGALFTIMNSQVSHWKDRYTTTFTELTSKSKELADFLASPISPVRLAVDQLNQQFKGEADKLRVKISELEDEIARKESKIAELTAENRADKSALEFQIEARETIQLRIAAFREAIIAIEKKQVAASEVLFRLEQVLDDDMKEDTDELSRKLKEIDRLSYPKTARMLKAKAEFTSAQRGREARKQMVAAEDRARAATNSRARKALKASRDVCDD